MEDHMKKYIAKMLRRAANHLDPRPVWRIEAGPIYTSSSSSGTNYKVVSR